jgi:hypothetical protein
MKNEIDPGLITEINSIKIPRLFQVLHIEGVDPQDMPFRVSFPEGLTEDTVEHLYVNPATGEKTVLMRHSEADELEHPLPN